MKSAAPPLRLDQIAAPSSDHTAGGMGHISPARSTRRDGTSTPPQPDSGPQRRQRQQRNIQRYWTRCYCGTGRHTLCARRRSCECSQRHQGRPHLRGSRHEEAPCCLPLLLPPIQSSVSNSQPVGAHFTNGRGGKSNYLLVHCVVLVAVVAVASTVTAGTTSLQRRVNVRQGPG